MEHILVSRLVHEGVLRIFFGGGYRGSESTKAFFTTDSEWMGSGWELRQLAWGFYPDRIRVIRG